MAVTAFASGTQAAAVGTEHFLSSPNVAGTFTLHVSKTNMVAGDILELRCYQMILTGGAAEGVSVVAYDGVQPTDDMIAISIPLSNELTDTNAIRFSLKQTKGTSRNFNWKVLKYA